MVRLSVKRTAMRPSISTAIAAVGECSKLIRRAGAAVALLRLEGRWTAGGGSAARAPVPSANRFRRMLIRRNTPFWGPLPVHQDDQPGNVPRTRDLCKTSRSLNALFCPCNSGGIRGSHTPGVGAPLVGEWLQQSPAMLLPTCFLFPLGPYRAPSPLAGEHTAPGLAALRGFSGRHMTDCTTLPPGYTHYMHPIALERR